MKKPLAQRLCLLYILSFDAARGRMAVQFLLSPYGSEATAITLAMPPVVVFCLGSGRGAAPPSLTRPQGSSRCCGRSAIRHHPHRRGRPVPAVL